MRQLPKKEPHEHMNTERVMERVRRLLAIANDPAASACFIDPNRFGEIARGVLQAARTAMQVH